MNPETCCGEFPSQEVIKLHEGNQQDCVVCTTWEAFVAARFQHPRPHISVCMHEHIKSC